jgi:beta-glucosidase
MAKKLLLIVAAVILVQKAPAQITLTEKNIDAVLKQMTLQEKADLLIGCIEGTNYFGVPQPTGSDPSNVILIPGAAGQTNKISRLGIPATVVADGPAGLRISPTRPNDDKTYFCTGYPVPILMASTWNTPLVERVGRTLGKELKEYGVDVLLAPGTNIMRNPLCGRNFEYYSEDPFLSGYICAAMVNGIQSEGVGACVKHFAANNQETNRNENDSRVDQRTLREIYLKPFEIVVKTSQPWSIMSAYNLLNGVHCQENYDLLTTVLRKEWGFKGFVMTDWTGKRNTSAQVHAGNDMMMPGTRTQIEQILADVQSGALSETDVDACVRRVLQYIVKTPRFKGYKYTNSPDFDTSTAITRTAASEGIVLLKNSQQTLPLADSIKNIAFFGVTSYHFLSDGSGSGHVSTSYVVNMIEGMEKAGYRYNLGIKKIYEAVDALSDAKYEMSPAKAKLPILEMIGINHRPDEIRIPRYIADASTQDSQMAIITIGRKPGEGADRAVKGDFELTETEQEMISNVCDAYHAVGKKVVVILNVGGVVETASWKDKPDAVVLAWMPGQEGGNSVADVLTGKVNPSGHLPITFPVHYSDVPSAKNYPNLPGKPEDGMNGLSAILNPKMYSADPCFKTTKYEEGINVGYRYYSSKGVSTSYPFGYGLSYTTFEFSDLKVTQRGKKFIATVTVRNTGNMAGRQVVQLYVNSPTTTHETPVRELKAFAKTELLQPGQSQKLTMDFSNYDLATFYLEDSAWKTIAGTYIVEICEDAETIKISMPLRIKDTTKYAVNNVLNN